MKTLLPFKTSPKPFEIVAIGDEEIGILELPRMNDLSPNERIYLREQMLEYPDLRATAAKMARAIATKSGRKISEVYDALISGKEETLDDYLEEFIEFQGLIEKVSQQRRTVLATAIIRYRLLSEWSLENTRDANLIPPRLVAAVADFGRKEEMGWSETEEGGEVMNEGKPEVEPTPEEQKQENQASQQTQTTTPLLVAV